MIINGMTQLDSGTLDLRTVDPRGADRWNETQGV